MSIINGRVEHALKEGATQPVEKQQKQVKSRRPTTASKPAANASGEVQQQQLLIPDLWTKILEGKR